MQDSDFVECVECEKTFPLSQAYKVNSESCCSEECALDYQLRLHRQAEESL